MSKGIYNPTYFKNNPEESNIPAVLYCVVLINKKTLKRECLKIGIAKGNSYRDIIKRSFGFRGYEARILKKVQGPLEEIYYLEEYLHELHSDKRYKSAWPFGGHTELFELDDEIIRSIPASV